MVLVRSGSDRTYLYLSQPIILLPTTIVTTTTLYQYIHTTTKFITTTYPHKHYHQHLLLTSTTTPYKHLLSSRRPLPTADFHCHHLLQPPQLPPLSHSKNYDGGRATNQYHHHYHRQHQISFVLSLVVFVLGGQLVLILKENKQNLSASYKRFHIIMKIVTRDVS